MEVRYVGTRSLNLPVQARLNIQTGFDAGLKALPEYFTTGAVPAAVPTPAVRLFDWDAFEGNAFQPTSVSPSGCVDPSPFAYGQEGFCGSLVTGFPTYGSGTYNGVSIDFDHRVGHGLTFMANYTYSRNYDNGTNELFTSFVNPRRSQDWRHISPDDWGPSTLDVPSKLALS